MKPNLRSRCAWCLALLMLAAAPVTALDLTLSLLDKNGKPLPEAVVIVETQQPGPRPALRAGPVIAQEQMRFVPTVSIVAPGVTVTFSNLDSWDHHVRGGAAGPGGVYQDPQQGFQFRLAGRIAGKPPSSAQRSFLQNGPQLLGCHLHASMRGHLYVTDSPWAAVSDERGQVLLEGLPEGPARLLVWHADQLLAQPPQELQLQGARQSLTLPTAISPRRRPVAPPQPYSGDD